MLWKIYINFHLSAILWTFYLIKLSVQTVCYIYVYIYMLYCMAIVCAEEWLKSCATNKVRLIWVISFSVGCLVLVVKLI